MSDAARDAAYEAWLSQEAYAELQEMKQGLQADLERERAEKQAWKYACQDKRREIKELRIRKQAWAASARAWRRAQREEARYHREDVEQAGIYMTDLQAEVERERQVREKLAATLKDVMDDRDREKRQHAKWLQRAAVAEGMIALHQGRAEAAEQRVKDLERERDAADTSIAPGVEFVFEGSKVGYLEFGGAGVRFTGDADASAIAFVRCLSTAWAAHIRDAVEARCHGLERQKERERMECKYWKEQALVAREARGRVEQQVGEIRKASQSLVAEAKQLHWQASAQYERANAAEAEAAAMRRALEMVDGYHNGLGGTPDDADHWIHTALAADAGKALLAQVEAGRNVLRLLPDHWPVRVICDHEAGTDQVVCSCSTVALPICQCVGEAIQTWIDHVAALAGWQEASQ